MMAAAALTCVAVAEALVYISMSLCSKLSQIVGQAILIYKKGVFEE